MATIAISIQRELTEAVNPPRALFLRWPFGHPLGEPFAVRQQRRILEEAFRHLETMTEPGIIDLPYRWRREQY
ncbi:MAG: hypothetical protein D6736_01500 [Nitrospinota bacterium]|nr:MAG: hypothetical protein D6736_01500 [Nitrospinota bacterium]